VSDANKPAAPSNQPAAAAPPKPAGPPTPPPPKNPGKVTLTIDGTEVVVNPGTPLIKAAEAAGRYIPHFCYHPGLTVVGQCRMCFVEVAGMPKLATACSTSVGEGMNVQTNSEKVKAGQNATLEFTLLHHPLDCPICDRGGECKLQDYTYEYGPPRSRMEDEKKLHDKHRPISEQVILDQERCILCTRCVRFSAEVDGKEELVVMNRGSANVVDVFEGRPFSSKYSGNVVDLCPVGALTAKDFRFEARPWELRRHEAVCTGCSGGCNIEVHTKQRNPSIPRPNDPLPRPRIERLVPRENMQVNEWWMCDRGRWGYHFHNEDEKRLASPSASLRDIQAQLEAQKGPWEFWIDDSLPHEGIAWAKELAKSWSERGRQVTGLNVSAFGDAFLKRWAARGGSPWFAGPAEWAGIKKVVAPWTDRELENVAGILALRLGQALRKGKLAWEKREASELFKEGDDLATTAYLSPVPTSEEELKALDRVPAEAKLLVMWSRYNSRGLLNEGLAPVQLLGRELAARVPKGPVFYFGQRTQNAMPRELVEYLSKAPFLVVADSFRSELSDKAQVVLPLTPLYESESTATNLENRRQSSRGIHLGHPNLPELKRGGPVVQPSLRLL
jgi:ferredoxin